MPAIPNMDRGRTRYLYQHLGGKDNSVGCKCLQGSDHERVHGLDEQQCHGSGMHKKNRGPVSSDVLSSTRDFNLSRAICDLSQHIVHSRGEHSCWLRQSSGPVSSSWVVASSLSVQHHPQGVWASFHHVYHKSKYVTALICVSCSRSHGLEGGCFQHSWDDFIVYALPSFTLRRVLWRVLIS